MIHHEERLKAKRRIKNRVNSKSKRKVTKPKLSKIAEPELAKLLRFVEVKKVLTFRAQYKHPN